MLADTVSYQHIVNRRSSKGVFPCLARTAGIPRMHAHVWASHTLARMRGGLVQQPNRMDDGKVLRLLRVTPS